MRLPTRLPFHLQSPTFVARATSTRGSILEALMSTMILVPLDTSPFAQQALATAGAIAKAKRGKLRLILVHETESFDGLEDSPWNGARAAMEDAYLSERAQELAQELGRGVAVDHPKGPAAETIVRHANAYRADLVVMTTHGRTGLSRAWMGSVADTIMRRLDIPVLMLRPSEDGATHANAEFKRVLIPLDGTMRAESIIDDALALAGTGATYLLARVVAPVPMMMPAYAGPYAVAAMTADNPATKLLVDQANAYLAEIAARLAEKGAAHVETIVDTSSLPGRALADIGRAYDADLVAIASRGRGASRLVLGSVTDELLKSGTTPLLVRRYSPPAE